MESETERKVVEVLAYIYRAVDWKRMHTSKISYDIFEHRLEFARHEKTMPELIQKLCNKLSLQAPPLPLDDVEYLRNHESEALSMIRKIGKLLTLKAAKRAKQLYAEKGVEKTAK